MWRDMVVGAVCVVSPVLATIGAERSDGITSIAELGCAVLERVELGDAQRLTFSWRNTCGVQIVLS